MCHLLTEESKMLPIAKCQKGVHVCVCVCVCVCVREREIESWASALYLIKVAQRLVLSLQCLVLKTELEVGIDLIHHLGQLSTHIGHTFVSMRAGTSTLGADANSVAKCVDPKCEVLLWTIDDDGNKTKCTPPETNTTL